MKNPIILPDGSKKFVYPDGTECTIRPDGSEEWLLNVDGKAPYREDCPAVIHADGTEEWYKDGVLVRTEPKKAEEGSFLRRVLAGIFKK